MSEKRNVPKLRFRDFSEMWVPKKLLDTGKITTGSTPSTSSQEFYDGDHHFVSPADIGDHRVVLTTKTTLSDLGLAQGRLIKKGAVFFVSIGSTIGKVGQASQDCITNQQINSVEASSKFSNDFLYYLLSKNGRKIKLLAGTQAVPQLNKTDFSKLEFFFPSLPEQQKIAEFLTSVDQQIELLQSKKEKLEAYKKGVMQKIFAQQLRFKADDGSDFPDWEERKLGEIGEFKNGLNKGKEDFGFGIPFINLMDVFGKPVLGTHEFEKVNASPREVATYQVNKGDVMFIRSSVKKEGVAEASLVDIDAPNLVYSGFLIRFRENGELLRHGFKKYCFGHTGFRKQALVLSTTSANTNISQESLESLKIQVPCSQEQDKVSEFLISLDKRIENLNQQINQTQTWKKGLLQKMFV